jgi:hypothetical protein
MSRWRLLTGRSPARRFAGTTAWSARAGFGRTPSVRRVCPETALAKGLGTPQANGIKTVEPVVRRSWMARCASAASLSG